MFTIVAVACLSAPMPAHGETVRGVFRYEDINPANGARHMQPIAHAKVEVWRCVPGFLGICIWGNARTVSTDARGAISEEFNHEAAGTTYGIRVFATNDHVVVWPNDVVHTLPFHREPGEDDNPSRVINLKAHTRFDELDFSYDFRGWSSQHFNIAETLRHGFHYANVRRSENDPLGAVNVQPTSASIGGTFYNAPVDTIMVESGHVFEDLLLLHEYAHFVQEQISTFAVIPSNHTGCDTDVGPPFGQPTELAWMEGFADFFTQAVALTAPTQTLQGREGFHTFPQATLEQPTLLPPCAATPPYLRDRVELFVAGLLWDLVDNTPAEPNDRLSNRHDDIFAIFDYELDQRLGHWPTVHDFRQAWTKRGLPSPELAQIQQALGIPFPENRPPSADAGADRTVDEGTLVRLDGTSSRDPEAGALSFRWRQVAGPTVALDDVGSATPTFSAPAASRDGPALTFELVVNDSWGLGGPPDTVEITVRDATKPTLDVPESATAEATSPAGAEVRYQANATDNSDANPVVACQPPSGAVFPLGLTEADCSARDPAGNETRRTIRVRVVDTTPPTLAPPEDIAVDATGPAGAIVRYSPPSATDVADPSPRVDCKRASRSTFAIGTSIVTCTATDAAGNSASTTGAVRVRGAAPQVATLRRVLANLTLPKRLERRLGAHLDAARRAIAGRRAARACRTLRTFARTVRAQTDKRLPASDAKRLLPATRRIQSVLGCTRRSTGVSN